MDLADTRANTAPGRFASTGTGCLPGSTVDRARLQGRTGQDSGQWFAGSVGSLRLASGDRYLAADHCGLQKPSSWLLGTHLACSRELRVSGTKGSVINVMFMQMALAIGREGRTIEALHLWSQQNELADDLSRASEGVLTTIQGGR